MTQHYVIPIKNNSDPVFGNLDTVIIWIENIDNQFTGYIQYYGMSLKNSGGGENEKIADRSVSKYRLVNDRCL